MEKIEFTKQELTIIYNVLTRSTYRLPDALVVNPLVERIAPLVLSSEEMAKLEEARKTASIQEGEVVNG